MAVIGNRPTVPDTHPAKRARKRPGWRRGWVWLVLTLLLAGAVAGGWVWWRARRQTDAAPSTYTTVSVVPAAYELSVSGPGTLAAAQSVSVSTPVAGTIQRLASVGDQVNKGQTLAQLETDTLQEALTKAQLALEQAQTQLSSLRSAQTDSDASLAANITEAERAVAEAQRSVTSTQQAAALAQKLSDVGSESASNAQQAQDAYDTAVATLATAQETLATLSASQTQQGNTNTQAQRNAELTVEQAKLARNQARRDLADATITAPIAGVVTAISDESSSDSSTIKLQAGTTLNAGQTLLTLSNYQTIELAAQVDETQISRVKVGQAAAVTAGAVTGQTFKGEVTAVSPSATVQDNIPIFEVTVQLANSDLVLRPGMTAEASIAVQSIETTLSVPSAAVQTFGDPSNDSNSVVELEQAGRIVPLPVEVVGTDGLETVVQVAKAPAGARGSARGSTPGNAPPAGSNPSPYSSPNAETAPTGVNPTQPDPSALVSSGEAVTVRVPSSSDAAPSSDASNGGRGGFGGPPPGVGFGGGPR